MKKIKKIFIYFSVMLFFDFILSNLFFKKKSFWEYERLIDHYWRITSDIYHHGLMANIDIIEPWGFSLEKRLITNSIGFRDITKKEVLKIPKKKKIALNW